MKHIIELYKQNRYKVISDRMIEVDSHNVFSQVKKGRTLIVCDCCNDTKFCNESPICRHKQFFIIFPFLKKLNTELESLIDEYKVSQSLSKDKEKDLYFHFTEVLERLRRFE